MERGNISMGAVYTPQKTTRLPYEIIPMAYQNNVVYFSLESAGTRLGDYKLPESEFLEAFSINNYVPARPVPFGIPIQKFPPFTKNLL